MKQMKCELCGSTDFVKEDGVFVCQYCGAKYSVEEAKKMMIEGTVDVSGSTVKVDAEADIDNWYKIARRSIESSDTQKAEQYYDMILGKRPDDWEASFYSVYCKALNTTYANTRNSVLNLSNSLKAVFDLIMLIEDEAERKNAVTEVCFRNIDLCRIIESSMYQFYRDNSDSNDARLLSANGIGAAAGLVGVTEVEMRFSVGNGDESYSEDQDYKNLAIALLKQGVETWKAIKKIPTIDTTMAAEKANLLQDQIQKLDPEFKKEEIKGSSCYVATAVYGSYDCPEVWTLRRYRDYELAETWYGRAFIHTYYAISPTIVKWFGHTEWFKHMWRGKLDRMVKDLQSKGYEDTPYEDRNW